MDSATEQSTPSRIEQLLSDALGYRVSITDARRRPTRRERIERDIARLEARQRQRVRQGRSPGAGAGGFNRDIEHIVHQIRLLRLELDDLTGTAGN